MPLATLAQGLSEIPGVPTPEEAGGYLDQIIRLYQTLPLLFWLALLWAFWRFAPKYFQSAADFVGDMLGAVMEPALSRAGNALDNGRAERLSTAIASVETKVEEGTAVQTELVKSVRELADSTRAHTTMLQALPCNIATKTTTPQDP